MNYIIFKSIIETTVRNYNAKEPHHKINENHVFITGIGQNSLDLLIKCPHTGREMNIKAEVNMMNAPAPIAQSNMQQAATSASDTILNDKDVMDVRQALKKKGSVEDLFGEE